jgi:hypothetical protein
MYSKRGLIDQAFAELGLASYVFDLEPAQVQQAAARLDQIAAIAQQSGLSFGYPNGEDDSVDVNTVLPIPLAVCAWLVLRLAITLAPSMGKTVQPSTVVGEAHAYNAVLTRFAKPIEQQMPETMPYGSGNKFQAAFGRRFYPRPTSPLTLDGSGEFQA